MKSATPYKNPSMLWEDDLRESGFKLVAGIDEAGRGALAGPVVASAVILPNRLPNSVRAMINDSKQLTPKQRADAFKVITKNAISCGVGVANAEEIDTIGIVPSTKAAMRRAIEDSAHRPDFLLIDAVKNIGISTPCQSIIKGDTISLSIAAASIVAKVTRDHIMSIKCDEQYPEYGFRDHKGYGTARHLSALDEHGPSPIHRRSFRPVSQMTADSSWSALGKAQAVHITSQGSFKPAMGIGKAGERAAARHLTTQGYKILKRNYRTRQGEVDIIAEDGDVLVFTEVKTRSNNEFGAPSEGFTLQKLERIRKAAIAYLATELGTDSIDWRIDFVGVKMSSKGVASQIELVKNAALA